MQSHNHFSLAKTNSFSLIVTKRDLNVTKIFLQDRVVLYFVISFGNIGTRLPCYRKDSKQGCERMINCSVLDNVAIDVDGIHGVYVGNACRSVLSDFWIILLLKTQERSQLLEKSHRHIRLHGTFAFHRRCSVFVLNGHGGTLRLRIVGKIKEKIDWLRLNSFADQRFVSSLKLSFHFVKYLTHDVLWLLVIVCW